MLARMILSFMVAKYPPFMFATLVPTQVRVLATTMISVNDVAYIFPGFGGDEVVAYAYFGYFHARRGFETIFS